jgi:transposase
MAFKGKDGSGWKEASAIYGKNASGWQYAKVVYAKNAAGWQRAWTDCRQLADGGRDWSSFTETETDTSACDSCGSRTRTRTRYEKEGCTTYYSSWSAWSSCSGSWNADTTSSFERNGYTYIYSGTPGYYSELFSDCRTCSGPCVTTANYYVTICTVTSARRFVYLSCEPCRDILTGDLC